MSKDYKISINNYCPCSQKECPIRGNCVLCVQNHLEHKRHIPECIENLLRPEIAKLAKIVEYSHSDERPDAEFWKTFDKESFLTDSLKRHEKL